MLDMRRKEGLSYRLNVAAMVLGHDSDVIFLGLRSDIEGAWQYPQGGIDSGENAREALLRELKEEIGTNSVDILGHYDTEVCYEFPPHIKARFGFDGQCQTYFLVRLKSDSVIALDKKEFIDYRFVPIDEIDKWVKSFKLPIYKEVIAHFKDRGLL